MNIGNKLEDNLVHTGICEVISVVFTQSQLSETSYFLELLPRGPENSYHTFKKKTMESTKVLESLEAGNWVGDKLLSIIETELETFKVAKESALLESDQRVSEEEGSTTPPSV